MSAVNESSKTQKDRVDQPENPDNVQVVVKTDRNPSDQTQDSRLSCRKEIYGVWRVSPTANGGQSRRLACHISSRSQDVPHLLGRVAELATSHTSTKAVVADTDGVVLERVGKIVMTLGHSSDEDRNALLGAERFDVVLCADDWCFKTESHFPAIGRQVVRNWILNDLE